MRNLNFTTCLTCLLAILISIPLLSNAQSSWVQVPSGTNMDLNGIHLSEQGNGYIVGDSGTALRSTDAGNSWLQMSVPFADFSSVAFQSDPDTGFITPHFGSILVTYDGGNNWTPDNTTFNGLCYWNKMRIDSNNLGWLLYDGCFGNFEIFTWDIATGDTTTFHVYNTFPYTWRPQDIDFPSRGSAVVVGDSGMVLRTNDNGDNWSVVPFPDSTRNLLSIDFVDANLGYLFSADEFWPKYKTTDGGASWAVDSSWQGSQTFYYPDFTDIEYHPNGNGMMAGSHNANSGGVVFYNSYNSDVHDSPNVFNGVDLRSDSVCFVIGDGGYIARFGELVVSRTEPRPVEDLGLYPNPSDGDSYLVAPIEVSDASVYVFDLQGRVVWQDRPGDLGPEEALRMDLSSLAPGTYYVELRADGKRWRERLIRVD